MTCALAAGAAGIVSPCAAQTVDIVQASDAVETAFTTGDMARGLALVTPEWRACQDKAGGDKATPEQLAPCVLLISYYASALSRSGQAREAISVARRAVAVGEAFAPDSGMALVPYFTLALALEQIGQHVAAEEPFARALAIAEVLLDGEPALASYIARRSNNLIALARFAEALPLAERAVKIAGDTVDGAFFRMMQGRALQGLGRLTEAETTLRIGITRLTALSGPTTPQVVVSREALAACLVELNRTDEAIAIWRETLAFWRAQPATTSLADTLSGMGVALIRTGQLREAETALREALALRLQFFGEASVFTALAYQNVGLVLAERGQLEESASMFGRAVAGANAAGGINPEEKSLILSNLALILTRVGEQAEAAKVQRDVLALTERVFGVGHARTLLARNNLATNLAGLGERAEAIRLLEINYDAATALGGQGLQLKSWAAVTLAATSAANGNYAAAARWYARADATARATFAPDHPQRIKTGWGYGNFLVEQPGGLPLARTLLREAGRQALVRASTPSGFDTQAREELNGFTDIFRDEVRAAWALGRTAAR